MKKGTLMRNCDRSIVRLLRTGRFLLSCGLLMIFTLYGFSAAALNTGTEKTKHAEYQVKAAYLYNFAKFVEWPAEMFADKSLPFGICIFGKDPFGNAIDTIKDKTVNGRNLEIKQYSGGEDVTACHIMFISPSEKKNLEGILEKIKDMHILTVSDMEGFADRGGMINLNKVEKKIRLEINIDAAKQSGLRMSSKLLKIAKIVKKGK